MERRFLLWGFIFGATAVVLGAFGAHALKDILTASEQTSFETGVRYQMFHAVLLLILSQQKYLLTRTILNLLVIGVLLFSFSIYLLNLREFLNADWLRFLGPITPFGGLLLISAWSIAVVKTLQNKMK